MTRDFVNTPLLLDARYVEHAIACNAPEKLSTALFPVVDEAPTRELFGDSIAIVEVHGALFNRGWASYEWIKADITAALENPKVKGIVLDIDSPGGVVSGVFDLTDWIYARRDVKPTLAIVNERACSAAFSLASACETVVTPRTGHSGSVGVLAVHVDISGALEQFGERLTLIHAGAHKIDGNPYQPLPDGVRQRFQAEVDKVYAIFVETIARNRGMSADAVAATEALVYRGRDAVDVGFADQVASASDALLQFHDAVNRHKGDLFMKNLSKQERLERAECCITAGTSLAASLNERIDELVTDDRSRSDIIEEMASAAGITAGTVNQILNAEINCPPLNRLEGFAQVLDVSVDSLVRQAEEDGCQYGNDDDDEEDDEESSRQPADVGTERDRIQSILQSPHAEGRMKMAQHLAFKTTMSVKEAEELLESSSKEDPSDPLSRQMERVSHPELGSGDDLLNGAPVKQSWDNAFAKAGAKLKEA